MENEKYEDLGIIRKGYPINSPIGEIFEKYGLNPKDFVPVVPKSLESLTK